MGVYPIGPAALPGLELLLEHGADANAKTKTGKTALQEAAKNGNSSVAWSLLKSGADVNAKTESGETALHWAADYGNRDSVELLLEFGAEIDARTMTGETPLQWALQAEHQEVADLLRSRGARPVAEDAGVGSQAAYHGWGNLGNRMWAVLIGIESYRDGHDPKARRKIPDLRGCVNDVLRVRQFLIDSMNLRPSHIRTLVTGSGAEDDGDATYENIVGALLSVSAEAEPDDAVYIHYSGHAGTVPTAFPLLSGKGRWDGVLVPADIRSGGRYLRDLELEYLLSQMVGKGLGVTVVLDCNYPVWTKSGGTAKLNHNVFTMDDEASPSAAEVPNHAEIIEWVSQEMRRSRGRNMLPERRGYSMFLAPLAWEILTRDGSFGGALTLSLLDVLQSRSASISSCGTILRRLHAELPSKIEGAKMSEDVIPVLVGEADRLFFGVELTEPDQDNHGQHDLR